MSPAEGGRIARKIGCSAKADGKPVENRVRRDPRGHAGFLRLFPDRLCPGVYHQGLADNLWAVGADPDLRGAWRGPRRFFLGLDGRPHRPSQSLHRDGAELLAGDRSDGLYARPVRLADPRLFPFSGRDRRRGIGRGRSAAGSGVCAVIKARLDRRSRHLHRFDRRGPRRGVRRLSRAGDRMARAVPHRAITGAFLPW